MRGRMSSYCAAERSGPRAGWGVAGRGSLRCTFSRRQRSVRIEVAGATDSLFLGEVVIPPAAPALGRIIARAVGRSVEGSPAWLTEGRQDGTPLRWSKGPARLLFDCQEMVGAQVRASAQGARPSGALPARSHPPREAGNRAKWCGRMQGALSWLLGCHWRPSAPRARSGWGREIALEEVQVLPARSWAQHCPYPLAFLRGEIPGQRRRADRWQAVRAGLRRWPDGWLV